MHARTNHMVALHSRMDLCDPTVSLLIRTSISNIDYWSEPQGCDDWSICLQDIDVRKTFYRMPR
jgi:hypothetical protein